MSAWFSFMSAIFSVLALVANNEVWALVAIACAICGLIHKEGK